MNTIKFRLRKICPFLSTLTVETSKHWFIVLLKVCPKKMVIIPASVHILAYEPQSVVAKC